MLVSINIGLAVAPRPTTPHQNPRDNGPRDPRAHLVDLAFADLPGQDAGRPRR
jgi:hypothetical protein